ncbi:50S ribosomal protein L4 [Candidatus Peregrinibacteria bacterium]|nr:50S ribosomal protein L4 [Candidatus Peregrinibacteria bacterium]
MKLDLYTQTGEKKGQVEVRKEYFDAKVNMDLMHQALVMQHANRRNPYAHTLTKAEVRGGGKKPYSQKGTGRARQGSSRNPQWKGGGVAFGPRNVRNYKVMMPQKQRRAALFSALTVKAKNNEIFALENYDAQEVKTRTFAEMVQKLPVEKDLLVVIPAKNEIIQKSARNIPYVKTILVNYLNIADLQSHEKVMFLKDALKKMEEVFVITAKKEKITKTAKPE